MVQKHERAKNIKEYSGVWIIAEQRNCEIHDISMELLGEGRKIADEIETRLTAVLLGNNSESMVKSLIKYGADKVIYADDKILEHYNTETYSTIISKLLLDRKPEIVLIGATVFGRDLAPRIAARINTGLTADCTKLEYDKENGLLLQTRPAFGGNLMATIVCPDYRPQMSTVRPGVMEKANYDEKRKGDIEKIKPNIKKSEISTQILDVVTGINKEVPLEKAKVIVSGGRGVGNSKGFELVSELAHKLGGEVGSSRACVENGWIDQNHQVGQTGKTVRPKLYIACGISGQIQHITGMVGSECIVAINKNPEAPIFKIAHYGIVGDLYQIIPEMVKAFDSLKTCSN